MLIILFLSIFIFFNLKEGIDIKFINFKNINIERLYVKLDKKFIVRIDKITEEFQKENKSNNIDIINLNDLKEYLDFFFEAFEYIKIEEIKFNDEKYKIEYKNSNFFISCDEFNIDMKISNNKFLKFNINNFFFRDFNLTLKGKLKTDMKNFYFYDGRFNSFDLKGDITASLIDDVIDFNITTKKSSVDNFIRFAIKRFSLSKELIKWSYNNLKEYENVEIKSLKGRIIDKKFDLNCFETFINIYNAKYSFNETIEPIRAKRVDLKFANKVLDISLIEPKINKKSIKGSRVEIYNFDKSRVNIDVKIKAKTAFDDFINSILKAYHIDIDIRQKRGVTKSNINLYMQTNPFDIKFDGDIFIKEALIDFFGLDVFVENSILKLRSDKLLFKELNIFLYSGFKLNANLAGTYDFKSGVLLMDSLIKKFSFDIENKNIVNIENKKTKIRYINFDDTLFVDFPELEVYLRLEKNSNKIYIDNAIKHLNEKIKNSFNITNANLKITSKDFKKYDIYLYFKQNEFFIERKSGKNEFFVNINYDGNFTKILSRDKSIDMIIAKNSNIKLDNLLIHKDRLEKFIQLEKEEIKIKKEKLKSDNGRIDLICNSCDFIIDENSTLFFDKIFLEEKKSKLNISANYQNMVAYMKKIDNYIDLNISNITSRYIKKITKKEIFRNGNFDLKVSGDYTKSLRGKLTINKTIFNDFVLLNNIFALINTLPALITFSDPGYSTEGYFIKKGEVDFLYKEKMLYFDKINIDGYSVCIDGDGNLSLENNEIDLNLEVSTFNTLTSVISTIPIIGYILFGEDKKISFGVDVKGEINNPQTETHLVEDIIKAPLNIIERTILLLFKAFEKKQ